MIISFPLLGRIGVHLCVSLKDPGEFRDKDRAATSACSTKEGLFFLLGLLRQSKFLKAFGKQDIAAEETMTRSRPPLF